MDVIKEFKVDLGYVKVKRKETLWNHKLPGDWDVLNCLKKDKLLPDNWMDMRIGILSQLINIH